MTEKPKKSSSVQIINRLKVVWDNCLNSELRSLIDETIEYIEEQKEEKEQLENECSKYKHCFEEKEDEIKNRISMALKDPMLQQGFESICKELAISEHDREHNDYELTEVYKKVEKLEQENEKLTEELKYAETHCLFHDDCPIQKENAELRNRNQELLESCEGATTMYKDLCKAKELLTRFIMASVYFNGKETGLVEEAEQFCEVNK